MVLARRIFRRKMFLITICRTAGYRTEKIAAFLDSKCSEIDTIISSKQHQLEILASYKKSLIYEYVTGQKEVI